MAEHFIEVKEKFDGTNWPTWSTSVSDSLVLKSAACAASLQDVVAPGAALTASQAQALAIIRKAVDNSMIHRVLNCKSPKEAWEVLEQVHSSKTSAGKAIGYRKLFNLRKEKTESVTQYINRGLATRFDLANVKEVITDTGFACAILNGLPEEYEVSRTICFEEPNLNMEFVQGRLLSREMELARSDSLSADERAGGSALFACHYCGKPGHKEAFCRKRAADMRNGGKKGRDEAEAETHIATSGVVRTIML